MIKSLNPHRPVLHRNNVNMIILITHLTVLVLSCLVDVLHVFSLSQKVNDRYIKKSSILEMLGAFIFNATKSERLKEKSLKYCVFFLFKG